MKLKIVDDVLYIQDGEIHKFNVKNSDVKNILSRYLIYKNCYSEKLTELYLKYYNNFWSIQLTNPCYNESYVRDDLYKMRNDFEKKHNCIVIEKEDFKVYYKNPKIIEFVGNVVNQIKKEYKKF